MQIFFEDEEDRQTVQDEDSRVKRHLPGMVVDRKRLPSIEGESRPPSAEHQHETSPFRKFKWTPVMENSETEADVDDSDEETFQKPDKGNISKTFPKLDKSNILKPS